MMSHMAMPFSYLSFALGSYLLFSPLITPPLTYAQPESPFFVPITASLAAFARTVNKLYVLGGIRTAGPSYVILSQFMFLDLTIPWNTTTPAWTKLANGPQQCLFPATFSSDEQTMFAFHIPDTNSPWQYSVQQDTWQESIAKFEKAEYVGINAVTDPNTGLIYLAGGYDDINYNVSIRKTMDIFDPVSQTIKIVDLPDISVAFPGRMKYGNVWSKHLNSVVYWGGENETPLDSALSNAVSQFSMETLAWSTMMTHGTAPGARYYHCMASNEDGKKVVIYGGNLSNDTMAGDLWILDVVTATWTQGVSGPPRINTVCAVAGDQFLIWGGSTPQSIVAPPEMLIYNITASRYVTQYTPPAFYKDLQPPPALSRTTAPWADQELSLRKSPTIIGASVGGSVMLIALFATAFFIRRRRRDGRVKRNSKKAPQETDNDSELERTLKELEDKRNEIEDQKKELDLKRELLVQQHQQSSQMQSALKRASKPMVGESYMLLSPPSAPHQLIPEPISYSHEDLNSRRTVQGVFGPIDMYQGDCYADHNPRRESDMAQDVIEPMYGPSSPVNSAIPDVVYHASPDVGMEWTKQHQDGHPHAVIDTITASNDNIDR